MRQNRVKEAKIVKARDTPDAAFILLTVKVSSRNDGRGKAEYISSVSFQRDRPTF